MAQASKLTQNDRKHKPANFSRQSQALSKQILRSFSADTLLWMRLTYHFNPEIKQQTMQRRNAALSPVAFIH